MGVIGSRLSPLCPSCFGLLAGCLLGYAWVLVDFYAPLFLGLLAGCCLGCDRVPADLLAFSGLPPGCHLGCDCVLVDL